MVDLKYVESQLNSIRFGTSRVNKAEVRELQHILITDEKIYECVNGFYEGGVALLVATDIRVLLIDKKPMGFLNVDDLRFDMISDIDYSHRIFGAQISINCGMKKLLFKSYNQQRLRKLIGHVQHRMSEIKKEQSEHASMQKQHLEEINKQLQMYLLAQQQQLESQMKAEQKEPVKLPKPSPQLADYLFAQRLLEEFNNKPREEVMTLEPPDSHQQLPAVTASNPSNASISDQALLAEMAEEARKEVFRTSNTRDVHQPNLTSPIQQDIPRLGKDMEPYRIACAKLPYLLKTRRYRQPFSVKWAQRAN